MARAFADISFTPSVKAAQSLYGSREMNQSFELAEDPFNTLGEREAAYIAERDSFYMATVSESGWPYVQHRGGDIGFLKVLDKHTVGFADFSGNRQYLSVGNMNSDERVSIILMDYPNRRRMKLWGKSRVIHDDSEPEILSKLKDPSYRARIERGIVINIEAVEWNCPQHITKRYTETDVNELIKSILKEQQA